jgi:hypothetical protein
MQYEVVFWFTATLGGLAWILSIFVPHAEAKDKELCSLRALFYAVMVDYLTLFTFSIVLTGVLMVQWSLGVTYNEDRQTPEDEEKLETASLQVAIWFPLVFTIMRRLSVHTSLLWIAMLYLFFAYVLLEDKAGVSQQVHNLLSIGLSILAVVILIGFLYCMAKGGTEALAEKILSASLIHIDYMLSFTVVVSAYYIHHHWSYFLSGQLTRFYEPVWISAVIAVPHFFLRSRTFRDTCWKQFKKTRRKNEYTELQKARGNLQTNDISQAATLI